MMKRLNDRATIAPTPILRGFGYLPADITATPAGGS